MDIIKRCAEHLNEGLLYWAIQNEGQNSDLISLYTATTSGKSWVFNACTVALIACAVFALAGNISTANALILGACSYFGRRVADESFSIATGWPSNSIFSRFYQSAMSTALKPSPCLTFGKIVLLYNTQP